MGQALLWIELLVASCLMVAVAVVAEVRLKRPWLCSLITLIGVLVPLSCWAAVTYIAFWLRMVGRVGPAARPWFLAILSVVFILVAIIILRRGMRDRGAARWPAWKLNLVFAAACVLSLMTFWNLDLNAKNRLGRLRARAGSIVVATFPPRIPDGQNAARVYEQAFESLEMMTDSKIIDWAMPVCNWLDSAQGKQSTTHPSYAKVRKILTANARGLNQLRRAAAMKQCNFVGYWDWTDLVSALMGHVSNMRTAGELLAADARMRAIDGDLAGAIADINASFAMSEHVTREPTVVSALVAMAIESRGIETMEIILSERQATASELASMRIDPLFSHGRMVRSALRGEEAMVLSILASLGDSEHPAIPPRYLPELLMPLYRVFLMGDEIRVYNAAAREWQRLAAMPYHRARDQWISFPKRMNALQGGFLTTRMLPAVSAYPDRAAESDAKRRLARLAIAMTICRVKTGALPESLYKLTPEFIEAIPADPFNGDPLRMILNKDGGAILYSVGPDLKDNGGRPLDGEKKRTGDVIFRLAPKK
ncbi:MAG: hypothetical protein ISS69_03750 [Phycisphaerae bacterium]|nr:hypothetical protein [Phycisphaerae bacterium]